MDIANVIALPLTPSEAETLFSWLDAHRDIWPEFAASADPNLDAWATMAPELTGILARLERLCTIHETPIFCTMPGNDTLPEDGDFLAKL